MKVAVAWGEKFSGVTRMTSVETAADGKRLRREHVLKRHDVGSRLHGRGGHAFLVSLPVDDGERLDLDDVELALDLEGDHVRFEVGEVAADLQPQHRVVVQGACLVWVPGGAQQQRARPPVPDLPAGVAADGFQVAVGNLGKVQTEPVPQQPDQVGSAARLHLRLEDAPAC